MRGYTEITKDGVEGSTSATVTECDACERLSFAPAGWVTIQMHLGSRSLTLSVNGEFCSQECVLAWIKDQFNARAEAMR